MLLILPLRLGFGGSLGRPSVLGENSFGDDLGCTAATAASTLWWWACGCWNCGWCIDDIWFWCWGHDKEVEELNVFLWNNCEWFEISDVWYPEGIWGDMGVIGVMGDVVVEELNAGDIDWSSEVMVVVVFKWLRCETTTGVFAGAVIKEEVGNNIEFDAALTDPKDVDAERFSIAELRRIIILLVFGNNKLLPLINSFTWTRELMPPVELCGWG